MIYIEPNSLDAAFHFSVEDYIMKTYPFGEPVLMIWQTDKCAMLGNYQVVEAEVDMNYARQSDVKLVRRPSGGGTIYTDKGTLLYTIIQPYKEGLHLQEIAKETVAKIIVEALNKMGIPAKAEGRNDILVDGKKVSGMAQHMRHGILCSHGSLLYDADIEALVNVLRVDEEKIKSKALKSVRSRVTNIKEYMDSPRSTQEFWAILRETIFEMMPIKEYDLTDNDLAEIEKICAEKYNNFNWTFGRTPAFSFHNSKRFVGGKVEVYLDVANGVVTSCSIHGDFLGTIPINELENKFINKAFQYEVFSEILDNEPIQLYFGNITKEEIMSCIFE